MKHTSDDLVKSLPGIGNVDTIQYAGYASIYPKNHKHVNEELFYWFVGAEDYEQKPTVIWTNGGPGSSSFWGFFLENGPYIIKDAQTPVLEKRSWAWNNKANFMIFEHPLSVTVSFANEDKNVPKTPEQGAQEYYQALLNFLDKHPEIAEQPIILAGESYAGTYLPLIAREIVAGNKAGNRKIDLQLTVLADAWVSPITQMKKDTDYAYSHGLISFEQKGQLDQYFTTGKELYSLVSKIQELCGCYMTNLAQIQDPPFQPVLDYLNRPDVREAAHIKEGAQLTESWSKIVSDNYAPSVLNSYVSVVQDLLDDNHGILILSGLNDAKDCNFLGTDAWLHELTGPIAFDLHSAVPSQWKIPVPEEDKVFQILGFMQDGQLLSWLKIMNAGHMAANDQPLIIDVILEKAIEMKKLELERLKANS